jgi:tape measure domain-containing protein
VSTTVGTIQYLVEIDTSSMKGQLKSLDKSVNDASDNAVKATDRGGAGFLKMGAAMGAVAGIAATVVTKGIDMISSSIGDAVKRVDTLNNSSRVFANMGFKAADSAKAMDSLKTSILGLPTPLDQAVRGMQMIASATGDIGRSQKIFSAMNNAIIGFGGNADMVNNAVLQMSQSFSNGVIDAQTWNSMMNSGLGPALTAIAKKMGITAGALKDGLSTGKISVKQFQDALIEMNEKGGGGMASFSKIAKDATAGIGTGMDNAKTAVVRGIAAIISAIGSDKISAAITNIGAGFEKLLKITAGVVTLLFTGNYDGKLFGGALSEDSGVVNGLLTIRDAVNNVYDAVNLLFTGDFQKGMFGGQFNEDSPLVSGILTVRDAFTGVYDVVKLLVTGDFTKDMFGGAFKEDSPLVNGILSVRDAFKAIGDWINNNKPALEILKTALIAIVSPLAAIAYFIIDNWGTIKPIIDAVVASFMILWDALKPLFDFIVGQLKEAWDSLVLAFQNIWLAIQPLLPVLETVGKMLLAAAGVIIAVFITAIVLVIVIIAKVIAIVADLIAKGAQIIAFFVNIAFAAKDAMDKFDKAIRDAINGAITWFGSLGAKIGNAIGNFGKLLYGAGRDLIQGLMDGITSLAGSIGNKIKDIANGAINMFKNVLGIHSPSTVFTGFGKNITQGLVNGITSGMGAVNSAVDNISGATIAPVVNTPTLATSGGLDNASIGNSQQPVTVNLSMDGVMARSRSDLRDIAKDMIGAVNEELRAKNVPQIGGGAI